MSSQDYNQSLLDFEICVDVYRCERRTYAWEPEKYEVIPDMTKAQELREINGIDLRVWRIDP